MNDYDVSKMYKAKVESCATRGIAFHLTFAQFKKLVTKKKCHYTGRRIFTNLPADHEAKLTLDRIDCNLPYTAANTVACANAVNRWKNTAIEQNTAGLTLTEMLDVLSHQLSYL